jgi:LTXXQ motif family protein
MRSMSKVLLALGVAVLLAGPTLAQGPRPQNPLKGLIENKDLQKELSLTDDQVKKAVTIADDIFKKHADDLKDIDFRSPEGREKMMTVNKGITTETKKALADVFDAKQMKRFNQVAFQQTMRFGTGAYADADLQKELKLTDEQKDKIKTINADLTKEREELFKDIGMDQDKRREAFQKMQGLNKEATEKITKLLTTEQKKTLEEMKGEEFKFPDPRPRPPQ